MADQNQVAWAMVKQRSVMSLADVIQGLQFLLNDARAGDVNAQTTLQALTRALLELEDFSSPLTVIRNQ